MKNIIKKGRYDMSLKIYFFKEYLGVDYVDKKIPLYEECMDREFDFKKELAGCKTYGLEDNIVYECAPAEIKTYLSVKYNTDKIYDISLCSSDMVMKLINLKEGRIYAPYMAMNYTFMKRLNKKVCVEVAVDNSGLLVKAESLEEILRLKKRVLDAINDFEDADNGYIVDSLNTYLDVLKASGSLGSALGKGEKAVHVSLEFLNKPFIIIGHTGDILHNLITDGIRDNTIKNEKCEEIEIMTVDFLAIEKHYNEYTSRSIAFSANLFDMFYSGKQKKVIVFDNIDAVISSNKRIYSDFLDYLRKESDSQFIIFSRLIRNDLDIDVEYKVADIKVNFFNNCIQIQVY